MIFAKWLLTKVKTSRKEWEKFIGYEDRKEDFKNISWTFNILLDILYVDLSVSGRYPEDIPKKNHDQMIWDINLDIYSNDKSHWILNIIVTRLRY